jgi:hypothetical protein
VSKTLFSITAILLLTTSAWAREVTVPVRLDLAFVRQALVAQIYTDPGEKAAIWDDGEGCGWVDLYEPKVDATGGQLHRRGILGKVRRSA